MKQSWEIEISAKNRFSFGANWRSFLTALSIERIETAVDSLKSMLGVDHLENKRFLDVGSGSGLFSLAARRLGAQVVSFDYDPVSVACTRELRRNFYPDDDLWIVEEGSVLDRDYLHRLGHFDIVYSWGVLHHTGAMWDALENISHSASDKLFIAIYNDQGWVSVYWTVVKRLYNSNLLGRVLMIGLHLPHLYILRHLIRRLTGRPLERGMSLWYDMLDWLGGFPFETAQPEKIVAFLLDRGFTCSKLKTCGLRPGCNEFIFHRHGGFKLDSCKPDSSELTQ